MNELTRTLNIISEIAEISDIMKFFKYCETNGIDVLKLNKSYFTGKKLYVNRSSRWSRNTTATSFDLSWISIVDGEYYNKYNVLKDLYSLYKGSTIKIHANGAYWGLIYNKIVLLHSIDGYAIISGSDMDRYIMGKYCTEEEWELKRVKYIRKEKIEKILF